MNEIDELPEGPAQPVQFPDDKHISWTKEGQGLIEAGAGLTCSRLCILEDFFASGFLESIHLEIEILTRCGNSGVADQHDMIFLRLIKLEYHTGLSDENKES